MTTRIATLIAAASLFVMSAAAPLPALAQGAVVPLAGQMKDFPEAHELPDPSLTYKIVFDVQSMPSAADQVSPALRSIGGIINTYRAHGVAADHLVFTAVFHGDTIVQIVDDATYKGRTGVDKNPNVAILNQLKAAGVQFVVCGQSAMAQHYDFKTILPIATMNLSATATFINLMTRGYIQIKA